MMSPDDQQLAVLKRKCERLEEEKEELLKLLKSTAQGALASSDRIQTALTKGLEAIGLAVSMIRGGEQHSAKSQTMFEEAVDSLHTALRFMKKEPQPQPESYGGLGVVPLGNSTATRYHGLSVVQSPTITCAECGKPTANFVENFCTSCFRLREGV